MDIPFNKPFLTGNETRYIEDAVKTGKISGNGTYTKKCQTFFEQRYGFGKCLLTTSCTDALEMAAILLDIRPGDEVIVPSYTFVSTANAFVLRGATLVFADSLPDHPNLDVHKAEELITPNTRAIVPVHYAGMACDMESLMELAERHGIFIVEDAAQALDGYYTFRNGERKALGSIGHLAAFSFHETKNIIAGEGGMLAINDPQFFERAEIIWEKGTNRSAFFRGDVDKYGWVDLGSSFLPSEIIAAFLWAQLEKLETIQAKRIEIWNFYYEGLAAWAIENGFERPIVPENSTNNGHMFYLVCADLDQRTSLIRFLREHGILAVFHYISLHTSPFYAAKHDGRHLPAADRFTDCLLRLPLFYELEPGYVVDTIKRFTL